MYVSILFQAAFTYVPTGTYVYKLNPYNRLNKLLIYVPACVALAINIMDVSCDLYRKSHGLECDLEIIA